MNTPTPNHQSPFPNPRAAIYARTATADQAGADLAIAAQLDRCHEDAQRVGYEVVIEIQDRGVSGATLDRPGLTALRDAIRRDRIGVVIVSSIDRLARSAADLLALQAEFNSAGVEVHIANCGNVAGAHADALLDQLTAAVADFERTRFVERMAKAKRTRRGLGIPSRSHPPFGYRYTGRDENRRLTVDRTEAAIVQQIVAWATGSDGNAPLPFDQVMERLRGLASTGSQDDAAALDAA